MTPLRKPPQVASDIGTAPVTFDRPCFICGEEQWCNHREREVVLAENERLAASYQRVQRAIA